MTVLTDCAMYPTFFRLTGGLGEVAYDGARQIAKAIDEYLDTIQ